MASIWYLVVFIFNLFLTLISIKQDKYENTTLKTWHMVLSMKWLQSFTRPVILTSKLIYIGPTNEWMNRWDFSRRSLQLKGDCAWFTTKWSKRWWNVFLSVKLCVGIQNWIILIYFELVVTVLMATLTWLLKHKRNPKKSFRQLVLSYHNVDSRYGDEVPKHFISRKTFCACNGLYH